MNWKGQGRNISGPMGRQEKLGWPRQGIQQRGSWGRTGRNPPTDVEMLFSGRSGCASVRADVGSRRTVSRWRDAGLAGACRQDRSCGEDRLAVRSKL